MADFKQDRQKDRAATGGTYAGGTRAAGSDELVDDLNKLLRGELSATETYRQALDKIGDQYGKDAKFQQLAEMQRDHGQAAQELRSLIQRLGGTPSTDSGAWGTWAKTVMGAARVLGDRTALNALQSGERSGCDDYQDIIRADHTTADVRSVLESFLLRNQDHVQQLDRMIEAS
jgi:uncharacterized protein (TIGR02284 family)